MKKLLAKHYNTSAKTGLNVQEMFNNLAKSKYTLCMINSKIGIYSQMKNQ